MDKKAIKNRLVNEDVGSVTTLSNKLNIKKRTLYTVNRTIKIITDTGVNINYKI